MKNLLIGIVFLLFLISFSGERARAGCGDINMDGQINVLDIIEYIDILFIQHGSIPLELGDINGSGNINVLDPIALIFYKYQCISDCEQYLNCPEYNHADVSSGCIEPTDGESIVLEVDGTSLTIYHYGAFYNCCLEYFVDYGVRNGMITAREMDFGAPCDCYCDFNLSSTLNDLEPGTYTVHFYGIEGGLLHSEDITIVTAPHLISSSYEGCLEYSKGSITYEYLDGILFMTHNGMEFNCSAELDGIGIEIAISGDTVRFFETNLSDQGAYCICDYNLTAEVAGLVPGSYIAEIYSQDFAEETPILRDRRELILE